jgi:predicted short-subunit dehydrogenase-like oxidoreductase (DUF2520 family)
MEYAGISKIYDYDCLLDLKGTPYLFFSGLVICLKHFCLHKSTQVEHCIKKERTMRPKLTIIGCGRLGKTLAFLWKEANLVCIQDIYNSCIESAKNASLFIKEGKVCASISQFKPADIYLIATPDDKIEFASRQLAEKAPPKSGSLVFHCSAFYPAELLYAVKSLGCYTASLHPLFGFSNPQNDVKAFAGTYCSFEGDNEAFDTLMPLIKNIGGEIFLLKKESKPLYHVGSVFASNYLVTLSALAKECYEKAGLSSSMAKMLVHMLMTQSLNRIKIADSIKKALTGPIQRGDFTTVKKHFETLQPFPSLQNSYKDLCDATIYVADSKLNQFEDIEEKK